MDLSSNSLLHLTKEKDSLKGILKDSFKLFCCHEQLFTQGSGEIGYFCPMVSFCDIPLSKLKNHIGSYGNYGIGLTKEWGERMGLNPVLYIERNSILGTRLLMAFMEILAKNPNSYSSSERDVLEVIRYLKNYQGTLRRKHRKPKPNYRFSDEREWRHVPPREIQPMFLPKRSYILQKRPAMIEAKRVIDSLRLTFVPNDITYLIIKEESEIIEFISVLRDVKGPKFEHEDIERLKTRIITTKQILTDF